MTGRPRSPGRRPAPRLSKISPHAEWLALVETVEPFLDIEVLDTALPQGCAPVPGQVRDRLALAVEELRSEPAKAELFVELVLREVLEWPLDAAPGRDGVLRGPAVPEALTHRPPSTGDELRPDLVLQTGGAARLLLASWPAATNLDRVVPGRAWAASPVDHMVELCRATGVSVGLVTNGWRWALVHATKDLPIGVATFDAEIWVDEPGTLAAFADLLGGHRWLTRPDGEHVPALLRESGTREEAVTGQLGAQVRAAVEHLVDAFSRADREAGGAPLAGVAPREVYRGAVTATMRMVFLLYAEDRGLLPVNDRLYAESYAMHSLFQSLRADADRLTEDILDRRTTAWGRLLATSRAVHSGVRHDALRLPAYGGALFHAGRFPWFEAVRVDDRTMLRVLTQLLVLHRRGRASIEAQALSYRSLDVEQIGYVYEGLLDHSAVRATGTVLPLIGPAQPELPLSTLEAHTGDGLVDLLVERMSLGSRRKVTAGQVRRWLAEQPDGPSLAGLRAACGGDDALVARVRPYWGVLRPDLRGGPLVYAAGAVYVTQVGDRRAAGAHYTPKHLAEEIVTHTLDPLCFSPGPADGVDDGWRVRPADELLALRVVDIAMGSGAFLVSACRYLANRVAEAWDRDGVPDGLPAGGGSEAEEERLVAARRLVADRCLYGVDRDDMAVEMAKLSLWLVTLARGRPFEFLDHALRRGDSLLGITSPDQLRYLHLDPAEGRRLTGHVSFFDDAAEAIAAALGEASRSRRELESIVVRDVRDAEDKAELLTAAELRTGALRLVADGVVAAALLRAGRSAAEYEAALEGVRRYAEAALTGDPVATGELAAQNRAWLGTGRPEPAPERECFHWPLEFPEVMEVGGFHAVVGNPPFQGGQRITGAAGTDYRDHLVRWLASGKRGSADLVAYFFLRAAEIAPHGRVGLLATNTIAQGDTREVGLDGLVERGWAIVRATKSMRWPGEATLEVSKVWLGRPGEGERVVLDDAAVNEITPSLDAASRVTGAPHRLAANAGIAFQGSNILGLGFTMTPGEARELIERDPRNAEVLFPYLNGEDLNSRPDCSARRWVINFRDWPIERAQQYPDCFERVVRLVKPERDRNRDRSRREIWWRFTRPALDLHRAIQGLDRVLVIALVSKVALPVFSRSGQVFSHMLGVFATDDSADLAFLSSAPHYWWAISRASSLKGDLRYTPSDVFETLARPEPTQRMRELGERLDAYRRDLMLDRDEGLTKTYNRVHDEREPAADIAGLRAIHVEIDHAVAEAYGWHDLVLDHGFHETRQGVRYTIGPAVRQEILDRLLELNFARHAEEARRGISRKRGAGRRPDTPTATLF
ncbi:MAG TPA: DNA methyltransferase [Micromonosporaceae bacterium]|nr:DNA methyltransferase [Micromonosporaceae bacterium]